MFLSSFTHNMYADANAHSQTNTQTDSKQGQAATWRLGLLINWTKMLCTQFIKGIFEHDIV